MSPNKKIIVIIINKLQQCERKIFRERLVTKKALSEHARNLIAVEHNLFRNSAAELLRIYRNKIIFEGLSLWFIKEEELPYLICIYTGEVS